MHRILSAHKNNLKTTNNSNFKIGLYHLFRYSLVIKGGEKTEREHYRHTKGLTHSQVETKQIL